jgi:ribosomal protein S18 acetylase RimI-like enzyme
MNRTTIRRAGAGELEQIQELNYQLFLSDARHFDDLNTNWPYEEGEKYFRDRIAGRGGVCLVAEKDGAIVGYVMGGWSHLNFSAYKGKRAELENICVAAQERSHGVGAQLVDALLEWCKQNGATHVMVDAYAPNLRAVQFYKAQGFEPYSSVLWRTIPD